jgi:hypothetical protein
VRFEFKNIFCTAPALLVNSKVVGLAPDWANFRPFKRLSALAFFQNHSFASHFGQLFHKSCCKPSNLDKIRVRLHFGRLFQKRLGYILVDFFKKASGHSVHHQPTNFGTFWKFLICFVIISYTYVLDFPILLPILYEEISGNPGLRKRRCGRNGFFAIEVLMVTFLTRYERV